MIFAHFYNGRFKDCDTLQDLVTLYDTQLFEITRDEYGRFCRPHLTDGTGHTVVDADDMGKLSGLMDFDVSDRHEVIAVDSCADLTDAEASAIIRASEDSSRGFMGLDFPELLKMAREALGIEESK